MIAQITKLLRLVRFSHTIFSIPFAAAAAAVAAKDASFSIGRLLLVLVCVVSARTAAMAFNRITDRDIDAKNQRTQNREIPRGKVSLLAAWMLTGSSALVFVGAAFLLSPLLGALALPVLLLALGYSYAKRFTWLCHFWLGVVLGLAPIGAWLAIAEKLALFPVVLGLGVAFWISGFDVTYALADLDFDKQHGMHSFPARFGARTTLIASRILHTIAALLFLASGIVASRGAWFYVGVAFAAIALLAGQVATARGRKGDDVFVANGWAALFFGCAVVLDTWPQS